MQDGFNLGWKLASVLRKRCTPRQLQTYSAERQAIAGELIEFDREWAALPQEHRGEPRWRIHKGHNGPKLAGAAANLLVLFHNHPASVHHGLPNSGQEAIPSPALAIEGPASPSPQRQ
jgi:hypothetical protein